MTKDKEGIFWRLMAFILTLGTAAALFQDVAIRLADAFYSISAEWSYSNGQA